jgi:hypothetical protein
LLLLPVSLERERDALPTAYPAQETAIDLARNDPVVRSSLRVSHPRMPGVFKTLTHSPFSEVPKCARSYACFSSPFSWLVLRFMRVQVDIRPQVILQVDRSLSTFAATRTRTARMSRRMTAVCRVQPNRAAVVHTMKSVHIVAANLQRESFRTNLCALDQTVRSKGVLPQRTLSRGNSRALLTARPRVRAQAT